MKTFYTGEFVVSLVLQRLNEARRMMDKLRACIVANYYANAGLSKLPEVISIYSHSGQIKVIVLVWYIV